MYDFPFLVSLFQLTTKEELMNCTPLSTFLNEFPRTETYKNNEVIKTQRNSRLESVVCQVSRIICLELLALSYVVYAVNYT